MVGLAPQNGTFAGRTVEPMTGFDLTPLLVGKAAAAHPADVALGYEVAGNSVVFKGDLKLVKNLPPYGDGKWALYDIANDPGETRDLSTSNPRAFQTMQSDFAAFAKRDQVLPMPPGYTAPKQVETNGMRDRLWPQLRALAVWVAGGLGLLIGGIAAFRRRRKLAV